MLTEIFNNISHSINQVCNKLMNPLALLPRYLEGTNPRQSVGVNLSVP